MNSDARLLDQLKHNLGPQIMFALGDPEVVEIMLNPDGKVWIERIGKEMEENGRMASGQGRLVISLVASALDTVVTIENPIVEGELPLDGSRFEDVMPPVTAAPSFTIRKKAARIFSLSRAVGSGHNEAVGEKYQYQAHLDHPARLPVQRNCRQGRGLS